jgi:hypothetical protein
LRYFAMLTGYPFGYFYLSEIPKWKPLPPGRKLVEILIEAWIETDEATTAGELKEYVGKMLPEQLVEFDVQVIEAQ